MKRTAMALPLHQMLSVDRSDAQAMKAKSKTLANLQRGKIPLLRFRNSDFRYVIGKDGMEFDKDFLGHAAEFAAALPQ